MQPDELKEGVPTQEQSPESQPDITALMLKTRAKIFANHPKGAVLEDVYKRVTTGGAVESEELEEARQMVCELGKKDIQHMGVSHHWLDNMDVTPFGLVSQSFAELGIQREDMRTLTWETEEQAIRNIRNRFFKYNPEMREAIESTEKMMQSAESAPLDAEKKKQLDMRVRLLRVKLGNMITTKNLVNWGIYGCRRAPGMSSTMDVLEKSFLNPATLASAGVNQPIVAPKKEEVVVEEKPVIPEKTPEELEIAMRSINPKCRQISGIINYLKAKGTKLTAKEVDEFSVDIEKTREVVRAEMFSIWNQHDQVITDSILQLNSSWVKKYSAYILEFLFGFGSAGVKYFKSKDFSDYAKAHTPEKKRK